jgi:hypothetical protein
MELWFRGRKLQPGELSGEVGDAFVEAMVESALAGLKAIAANRLGTFHCPQHPETNSCKIVLKGDTPEEVLKSIDELTIEGCCSDFGTSARAVLERR